jgi:hypothetical protein
MDDPHAQRFAFAFEGAPAWMARSTRLLGVTPERSWVDVDDEHLVVRFGRCSLSTPRANVAEARVTGPYHAWKVAGPFRISWADRGLTFGTTPAGGVCVRFHEPVAGPLGARVRHPAVTLTVADLGGLVGALA